MNSENASEKLSEHFTLTEATRTETGLPNDPGEYEKENLKRLCNELLEPIRSLLGVVIIPNSMFRCTEVNRRVGGAKNSAHLEGRACDFRPGNGMDIMQAFGLIRISLIDYDKLIIEHKSGSWWIHVQIARKGNKARRLAYRAELKGDEMVYTPVK